MDKSSQFIADILQISVNAPSGHNCQPWKFVVDGGVLRVWNLPEKDKTLFNYRQKGSLIANGALIENIVIVSSEMGYKADVELFPEAGNDEFVAKINFSKANNSYQYQYLFPSILKRTTNRKPFKRAPLSSLHQRQIIEFLEKDLELNESIFMVSEPEKLVRAASLFSVGDRLLFDNFHLHKSLFSVVNWTKEEEVSRRHGLFVDTKELPPPVKIFFKYFVKNWNLLNFFSFLDLPYKMSRKRKSLYCHSSSIGLVTSSNDSPRAIVKAGRILQRFWLKVSAMGLSFQPVSVGLLYLGQRTEVERPDELSVNQYDYTKEAYRGVLDLFEVGPRHPSFSFRIGYADPPTTSSLKKPPDITFL